MLALAKAQGQIGDIPRNRTVTVQPKSGGQAYHFKYATLSAIIDAIKKPLSDNGLAYTQIITHDADGGFYVLTTTLYHGNQFLSSKVPLIAEGGTNQQFGSALTYMKRYALAALLGIAADEDDDGNAADGNAADGNEIKVVADKAKIAPKAPAVDPISTVVQRRVDQISNSTHATPPNFSPERIEVPLLADSSGTDWMAWGQTFMAAARNAPELDSLMLLEEENKMALKNMEKYAPKMYANMTLALIKVRKALERTNA